MFWHPISNRYLLLTPRIKYTLHFLLNVRTRWSQSKFVSCLVEWIFIQNYILHFLRKFKLNENRFKILTDILYKYDAHSMDRTEIDSEANPQINFGGEKGKVAKLFTTFFVCDKKNIVVNVLYLENFFEKLIL